MADADLLHLGGDRLDDLGPDGLVHHQPGARHADLPGVAGEVADDVRNGRVQVGVTQHHLRRLAAELQVQRDQARGARLHHLRQPVPGSR